jgi:hypothetical protein
LPAVCQSDSALGILPFSTHSGGRYDTFDAATGNITVNIPIVSKAGKIPFVFSLVANFHSTAVQEIAGRYWIGPNPLGGYRVVRGVASSLGTVLSYTTTFSNCLGLQDERNDTNFVLTDATGAGHVLPLSVSSGPCFNSGGNTFANDGSGYTLIAPAGGPYSVRDRSGNQVPLGELSSIPGTGRPNGQFVDPDGVTTSVSLSGNTSTYVDTLGQTAMTAVLAGGGGGSQASTTPDNYTYTDVSGNPQSAQVRYTLYPWRTNYACSGVSDAPGITVAFPTSIVLADGQTFAISYEGTPGYAGSVTGRLAKLTLPTGGYVAYAYSGGNNGIRCSGVGTVATPYNMETIIRTENDGSGHSASWTYTASTPDTNQNFTTTETDPAGNTTTYYFHGGFKTQTMYEMSIWGY